MCEDKVVSQVAPLPFVNFRSLWLSTSVVLVKGFLHIFFASLEIAKLLGPLRLAGWQGKLPGPGPGCGRVLCGAAGAQLRLSVLKPPDSA